MVKLPTVFACVFFLGFAAFSVKVKNDISRKEALSSFEGPVSFGSRPPAFELMSTAGTSYQLEQEVKGRKVVLINFWATWCPPCRLEMPVFEKLYTEHGEAGLQILAVNVGEDEETVESFLSAKPVSFPVLLDRDEVVSTRYRIEAFPTSVILDAQGKVVDVIEGLDPYLSYRVESHLEPETENEDEP